MSGQERDYMQEIEGQMQAAQALIESLEEEVTSLQSDLEQASVALKAAQEEVVAREEALEETERARSAAETIARDASGAISELRIKSSDEQLSLMNQHISELARLQDRFQDQLRAEIESALSVEDREELREEHSKVRQTVETHYEERIAALEKSYLESRERLLEGEQEFDKRCVEEIEAVRKEAEDQSRELEHKLHEQLEQQVQEALRSATEEHQKELEAQRKSFTDREPELQAEFEARQAEMEGRIREAEEQHQAKLREIKSLAENREQELKKTHLARLAETKAEAERRIESLQAQREADNKALRSRHEEDLSELRAQYERRLQEVDESHRLELWTAQEKMEGFKLERISEAEAYRGRLKELETALQSKEFDAENPEASTQETPKTEAGSQEQRSSEDTDHLQVQIEELKAALAMSERARETLSRELKELQECEPEKSSEIVRNGQERQETLGERDKDFHPDATSTDERIQELEARLRESREESFHNAEELQRAMEELRRLSDPEHRMRGGISAFNASEHAGYVSSISKSLGLPKVHAGMDDEANKPIFTFVWEELAWRRYIAEPAEDLQEPRVYLLGGGDEPEELGELDQREPNARIDARGRLILGVQAR